MFCPNIEKKEVRVLGYEDVPLRLRDIAALLRQPDGWVDAVNHLPEAVFNEIRYWRNKKGM